MNSKKLLNSKWTALKPVNKEKHFMVTKVQNNLSNPQIIEAISLQALMSKKIYVLKPSDLKDTKLWKQGWL